jgi:hypothetical protein
LNFYLYNLFFSLKFIVQLFLLIRQLYLLAPTWILAPFSQKKKNSSLYNIFRCQLIFGVNKKGNNMVRISLLFTKLFFLLAFEKTIFILIYSNINYFIFNIIFNHKINFINQFWSLKITGKVILPPHNICHSNKQRNEESWVHNINTLLIS